MTTHPGNMAPVANKVWKQLYLLVLYSIGLVYYSLMLFCSPLTTTTTNRLEYYTCGFRKFRDPLHHEGLPFLSEVFATKDSVYFAGENRGICDRAWRGAQDFWGHHFVCEFPDGTKVTSDPVPPTVGDLWSTTIMLIRCDLPVQYQSMFEDDEAETTQLVVHLHGTIDLEQGKGKNESHATLTDEFGVYRDLPVCPRKWPQTKKNPKSTAIRAANTASASDISSRRKYFLSMTTLIRMEYKTWEAKSYTVRVNPLDVVSWLEYNLMIGFEHFYIFDNDPTEHSVLEKLLTPYVEEGLVDYVWYPRQDCYFKSGSRLTVTQATSAMMSLRRYEHETTFMGHFDIDEYIQLPANVTDVKQVLKKVPPKIAYVRLKQQRFQDCANLNSTSQPVSGSPLTRVLCINADGTPPKSIMRTSEVLGFFVHTPWVKMNHNLTNWRDRTDVKGLSIAHVRGPRGRDNRKKNRKKKSSGQYGQQYIIPNPADRVKLQQKIAKRMNILGM